MYKTVCFITFLLPVILFGLAASGCEPEEVVEKPVTMAWGIPEEVTAFEDLQRKPQGVEVERPDEHTLQVTWKAGESYILPLSATSDRELPSVRYQGSGIPEYLDLEWLDPRQEVWFPIEDVPEERVKAVIEQDNDYFRVDFGPPEGADFDEGMTRLIWFRITPTETGQFEFDIFGYQLEEGEPEEARISNVLSLEAEVIE